MLSVAADLSTNAPTSSIQIPKNKTRKPWPTQHLITTYGYMSLLQESLELADKANCRRLPGDPFSWSTNQVRSERASCWLNYYAHRAMAHGIPVNIYSAKDVMSKPIGPTR